MNTTSLRPLALTVEEREPRRFTWVLLERACAAGTLDEVIAIAPEPVPSYSQAIRQGAEALAQLARRNPAGPRLANGAGAPCTAIA